jgi:hypothetical protein
MYRRPLVLATFAWLSLLCSGCGSDDDPADVCQPDDLDGVIGGAVTFDVTVDDGAFSPRILSAQNRATVTLTLRNAGSEPRGFFIECLPTPNDDGCATESCFPDESRIEPLEPGDEVTVSFEVPLVEGTYTIVSEPGQSEPSAQFVVK